jgi:hypothetical protein
MLAPLAARCAIFFIGRHWIFPPSMKRDFLYDVPSERMHEMFKLLRLLFVVLICVAGIGLYRGWFTVSKGNNEKDPNNVNINLSVDKNKMESDVETAKQRISQKVAEEIKNFEKSKSTDPS